MEQSIARDTTKGRISFRHKSGRQLESVVLRTFAFFSSIVTGTVVGATVGLVAWMIERVRRT